MIETIGGIGRALESVIREVATSCLKTGSWQLAKEVETERLLFPEAYKIRMGVKRNE